MKKLEKVVYDTYNQGYNIEVIKYLYNLSNIELASLLIKHSNSSNEFYLMNNDYKIVYYEKPNFKIGKRENLKFSYDEFAIDFVNDKIDFYDVICERTFLIHLSKTRYRKSLSIRKIDDYKRRGDFKFTLIDNDLSSVSCDTILKNQIIRGSILNLKLSIRGKDVIPERFIYISRIDKGKVQGYSTNTYLRAKKLGGLDLKFML